MRIFTEWLRRAASILPLAVFLASCMGPPSTGKVLVTTNGAGQVQSIVVSKSTGDARVDKRALLFVKNTFAHRVPHPRARHRYVYPVAIATKPMSGRNNIRVSWF